MTSLTGKTTTELERILEGLGEPRYRGGQVARWIYQRAAADFDEMTDLPKALRARLQEQYVVRASEAVGRQEAADGTVKLALRFPPDAIVECVLMPSRERASICVSTQVGCPVGCVFCATGAGGFERSLDWREIVEQVLAAAGVWRERGDNPTDIRQAPLNVVYMGMGEPFLNYRNTLRSVRFIRDELGIGSRSITISTVGLPEGIRQLARDEPQVNLAISLAAPTDELRRELVPGLRGRAASLSELVAAAREYLAATNRRVSFEYVLLRSANSRTRHAHKLADLLKGLVEGLPGGSIHVNLIAYNDTGGAFERPSPHEIEGFCNTLHERGVHPTIRDSRGEDIAGACGQLRGALRGRASAPKGNLKREQGTGRGSAADRGRRPPQR